MVRGRGYWKNNVTCFQDEKFLKDFETKWQNWKQTKSSLGLVDWWIEVKNKIKKLVIDHSTRLRQESFAIENDLKQQLDQLAISQYFKPKFKLYKETKKKLTKMQIDNFKKKLIKNRELFQYSHNLVTKEFFRQFLQKREKVVISELNAVCLQQHLVKWWSTCGNSTPGCIDAIKLIFHSKISFLTTSAQNYLTSRTVTFKSTLVNTKLKQQSIKWLKGKPQAPTGSVLSSTFTAGPLLNMKLLICWGNCFHTTH